MNDFLFYVKENQTPPTYSSLNFFIFSFSPIKKNLFSWAEWPTKLNLGPHMDSGLVHHVYSNQAACAYLFLYQNFFNFLSLQFQNMIFLSHFL